LKAKPHVSWRAAPVQRGTKVAVIDSEPIVVGGDIILEVQGIAVGGVSTYETIREALAGLPSGASIDATVVRAGQILELTGTIP
jgi:hypothetical protein